MQLYADEDFALPVVTSLRRLGHDVLTVQDDGHSGKDDADVLRRANVLSRVVLTYNRRDFERLHRQGHPHHGIISCTHDNDFAGLAARIDRLLVGVSPGTWCLRVNRKA